jgi:alkanesulfonate monooxygenase SsuD/methylene tetrahydromethanopterin reductase-like flavin-dependent oxidoreductase (luciferase family)
VAPLYAPARLLAEIGMVDCLSDGRLVLGLGSGYQPFEFERFGKDLALARPMLDEFLDMLHLAFAGETFTYDGQHYRMPSTHISARPVAGLPEIWIAGDNEFGHRLCARRGYVPLFTGRWSALLTSARCAPHRRRVRRRRARSGQHAARRPALHVRHGQPRRDASTMSTTRATRCALASALRRRAEVTDGAMMREIPIPNEIFARRDGAEPPGRRLRDDSAAPVRRIRAARPSHMMFHFQVGGSSHVQALHTMEKLMGEIVPLVEREMGPLASLQAPKPAAAAVVH